MIRNYRVEPVARKIPSRKEIFTRQVWAASLGSVSIQYHRLGKWVLLYN